LLIINYLNRFLIAVVANAGNCKCETFARCLILVRRTKMLSIIITSYKEPKTIGRAIESFINQNIKDYELLVLAPDKETLDAAKKYSKSKKVKIIKDQGKGKPAALNLAFEKAKGSILILSDGDVFVENNSVNELLKKFNKNIGAVSGRPISLNPRNSLFGYWSRLLTDAANNARIKKKIIECSGYLYAIRNLKLKIPENILSEDGYVSHLIHSKGYEIEYAPDAKVYVKYPDNFKDWILQKKRSAGGYTQIKEIFKKSRSFSKESTGIFFALTYAKNLKELIWTKMLILARLYLWLIILKDLKLKKEKFKETWKRVESTK